MTEAGTPTRQIRFCVTPAGVRVAYATLARGPTLLVPAAWISHLELLWQDPAARAFFTPLAAGRTLVQYDKPGCGLSDPWPGRQTLATDLQVPQAVADHLELERFNLLGISTAAPLSIAFAARHPARVGRLILYGGYADGRQVAAAEVRAAMLAIVRAHWGLGSDVLADLFLPDAGAETRAHFTRLQRGAAPAGVACELLAQCYETRVEDQLAAVATPTLVLHRRGDRAARPAPGRAHGPAAPGRGPGRRGPHQPADRGAAGHPGALRRGAPGAGPAAARRHLPRPDRRLVGTGGCGGGSR